MASAVTTVQVTQFHFQEHLQTAVSQICQASPAPPSSSISEIQSPPRLGCSTCKSELTVPPNPHVPSQPVMVEDLSPMCHTHDEESLTVHWCHPLGHLEGRTWMNLTHTTFLGHNYDCPTLRRRHTEQTMKSQTYFPSALIRSERTLLGPHTDPDGSASQESLPPSLHPWLVCALISLEYVLFWVNFTWCLGSF